MPAASNNSLARAPTAVSRSAAVIPHSLLPSSAIVVWRSGFGAFCCAGFIAAPQGDGRVALGVRPETKRSQQAMQVGQRRNRSAGRADLHASTGDQVQHPGGHHHDNARRHSDMNHTMTGPALTGVTVQPTPVKRVPPVMDDDLLPDVGRMTQGWPSDERRGCSPAWTSGQVVRVARRSVRDGNPYLSVELPGGSREQILRAWTEDLIDGGSAVPALLFSPSSLRALVRLVREHGRAPSAETSHALTHDQDLEAPAAGNACRDDPALRGVPDVDCGRGRGVHAVGIDHQRLHQPAQVDQVVPVPTVAGKPGGLDTEHGAG